MTVQGYSSSDVTVDGGGAPYTIRITANDVKVRQLRVRGGSTAGVYWDGVDRGYLEKCTVYNNNIGILLEALVNQTIRCNLVRDNTSDGIQVKNSELKDVQLNTIHSNGGAGLALRDGTWKIVVAYNESRSNQYGIYIDAISNTNDIYLNDFYNNDTDGYSAGSGNNWELPGGLVSCYGQVLGNYWGDYSGSDGDSNGVGDTPHSLGTEQDSYPLMDTTDNYPSSCQGEPPECTAEASPPDPPGGWPTGGSSGGGCFIATAAYGSYMDSHVETLRSFRDGRMESNAVGSAFVSAYYRLSPPVADFIDDHPVLKPAVRAGLLPATGISTAAVDLSLFQKAAIALSTLFASSLLVVMLRRRPGASGGRA
jgi:hypothetical protein